jgi:prophage regulatory protein
MEKLHDTPRLLPWPVLREIVPYTRQHLGRLEQKDLFPKRVMVGPGRIAWIEEEIRAWIAARASQRKST